ncbi:MAG: hypothetical protein ACO2PL_09055 [Armatimonadota bacterium]
MPLLIRPKSFRLPRTLRWTPTIATTPLLPRTLPTNPTHWIATMAMTMRMMPRQSPTVTIGTTTANYAYVHLHQFFAFLKYQFPKI